jgi:hypothetical protein
MARAIQFACISDTHNQLGRVCVPDGDVLLHKGDFPNWGSLTEVERFSKELRASRAQNHYSRQPRFPLRERPGRVPGSGLGWVKTTHRSVPCFPPPHRLSKEFLVVELLNHLDELMEDCAQVLNRLREKLADLNQRKLAYAASHYGTLATQKRLKTLSSERKRSQEREKTK